MCFMLGEILCHETTLWNQHDNKNHSATDMPKICWKDWFSCQLHKIFLDLFFILLLLGVATITILNVLFYSALSGCFHANCCYAFCYQKMDIGPVTFATKSISACCVLKGNTGFDEFAQVLTQKKWKMSLHPVLTGSWTSQLLWLDHKCSRLTTEHFDLGPKCKWQHQRSGWIHWSDTGSR